MTYFELFNLAVSLQPDQKKLKEQFYILSRKYHPDFFTNEPEEDQSQALETSSLVNKAYKTFRDQDETIKYVLIQKGLLQEEEKYTLPPGFLMEMLELNEEAADAKMEEDDDKISIVRNRISDIENNIYEPAKEIVEHYEEGITTEKELLQVKEYYFKKKYLRRILAGIG